MRTSASSWRSKLAHESGFAAMVQSSRDIKVLCLQRFVRLFGYGASFLILVHFLTRQGISDARVGLFMTLTVLGDAVISVVLTTITDQVGRRRVMAAGAILMAMSGLAFASSSSFWVLLLASVLGVISPSGNEIGPFRAVEESILAQLTPKEQRSDVFAWYTLLGTAGAAMGTVACGWTVQGFQGGEKGGEGGDGGGDGAYRVVFCGYAVLGLVKLGLNFALSEAVEVDGLDGRREVEEDAEMEDVEGLLSGEEDGDDDGDGYGDRNTGEERRRGSDERKRTRRASNKPATTPARTSLVAQLWAMVPHVSLASRSILSRLLILFTLDSFASGMASPSWLTYFFTTVHGLQPSSLGTLFLVTNLLATLSNLLALPLARRLGPLKTMVYTHLPSAIFLSLIALPPATTPGGSGTWLAMALLALRACTQSMDQAPRQAFLAAAVLPAERTAVLGVVNIVKTVAQAGGLGSAGLLSGRGLWVFMFGGAGLMKAGYDLMMLYLFVGLKDREGDRM